MKNKGFTIVESLVAISILIAAITGAMSAAQSGISSYIFSKDQISAFYLAQEGFEQIKNVRDENWLNSRGWLSGIAASPSDPCYFGEVCTVSPIESSSPIRCNGSCAKLRQDSAAGFYGYNSTWPETGFTREIEIASVSPDEISVTVTISWSKGLINREFKARENLLNWQ